MCAAATAKRRRRQMRLIKNRQARRASAVAAKLSKPNKHAAQR